MMMEMSIIWRLNMSKVTDRIDLLLKLNYTIDQAIAITQAEQLEKLVTAVDMISLKAYGR